MPDCEWPGCTGKTACQMKWCTGHARDIWNGKKPDPEKPYLRYSIRAANRKSHHALYGL